MLRHKHDEGLSIGAVWNHLLKDLRKLLVFCCGSGSDNLIQTSTREELSAALMILPDNHSWTSVCARNAATRPVYLTQVYGHLMLLQGMWFDECIRVRISRLTFTD